MIPTIRHDGRGQTTETVKNSGLPAVSGEGGVNRAQRILGAVGLCCRILCCWIHVITHLCKPTGDTAPGESPNVNGALWVVMTCRGRFVSCNQRTM